jgi:hypothetical protein
MKSRRRVKTVKKQKKVKVKRTKVGRKRSRNKPSKRKPRKKTINKTIKKTINSMKVVKGGALGEDAKPKTDEATLIGIIDQILPIEINTEINTEIVTKYNALKKILTVISDLNEKLMGATLLKDYTKEKLMGETLLEDYTKKNLTDEQSTYVNIYEELIRLRESKINILHSIAQAIEQETTIYKDTNIRDKLYKATIKSLRHELDYNTVAQGVDNLIAKATLKIAERRKQNYLIVTMEKIKHINTLLKSINKSIPFEVSDFNKLFHESYELIVKPILKQNPDIRKNICKALHKLYDNITTARTGKSLNIKTKKEKNILKNNLEVMIRLYNLHKFGFTQKECSSMKEFIINIEQYLIPVVISE